MPAWFGCDKEGKILRNIKVFVVVVVVCGCVQEAERSLEH